VAKPNLKYTYQYYTAPQVRKALGLSSRQLDNRISYEILPAPTFIDEATGVRYFSPEWLKEAKNALNNGLHKKEAI
jgi:hypothetical protein